MFKEDQIISEALAQGPLLFLSNKYLLTLCIATVYFIAAKIGLLLAFSHINISPVWPPTGVAIAAMLLLGYRIWPGILLGAFFVSIHTLLGSPLPIPETLLVSLSISIGNTLEAICGVAILHRYTSKVNPFDSMKGAVCFVFLASPIGTFVSATIGVTTLCVAEVAPWNSYLSFWGTWWVGDIVGALTITPLIVSFSKLTLPTYQLKKSAELVAFWISISFATKSIFDDWIFNSEDIHSIAYLLILFPIWSSLRFSFFNTFMSVALISAIAILGTLDGFGPFVVSTPNESLLSLQLFMGTLAITFILLNASLVELTCFNNLIKENNEDLELRITRRTEELKVTNEKLSLEISQNRRNEKLIKDSEKKLKEAQAIAHIGHWELDINSNSLYWSDEIYDIFGFSPQEFDPSYELFINSIHPEDRKAVNDAYATSLETKVPYEIEHRVLLNNGTLKYVREQCNTSYDEQGNAVRSLGTIQDITNTKELENQLRHSQKMESLGTLSGGIAHDFNNILGIISGNIELFNETISPNERQKKYLNNTFSAIERAANLTKQILTFSSMELSSLSKIHITEIVEEAVAMLKATTPSNIEIVLNIKKGVGLIMADPTQIHQVIVNLYMNAVHAIDSSSGKIEITLKQFHCKDCSTSCDQQNDAISIARLSIKDSGSGIHPNILDKIFDPFFTTKEVGKGTGLGLGVVHGIMESHGGNIEVESELGHGTTITLCFPLIKGYDSKIATKTESHTLGKGHILVVEDEPDLLIAMRDYIEGLGYSVTPFNNGHDALTHFTQNPNHTDLIITDQAMPKMTGGQLSKEVFKIRNDIPIILLTGYSSAFSKKNATDLGIRAYVTKPVSLRKLSAIIHTHINN